VNGVRVEPDLRVNICPSGPAWRVVCLLGLALVAGGGAPVEAAPGAAADAAADAAYVDAIDRLREGRHAEALEAFRRLQRDFPDFDRLPAVQTRIAVLHDAPDGGPPLAAFLAALDLRDAGDTDAALARLDALARDFPEDDLADDALYLAAYVRLMDRYAFAEARTTLLELGSRFPDTAYRDSAVYLDAIALEQLGDTGGARAALASLRERHTALSLPFEFRWPAGGVLSRYWFDRAERRLRIIDRRLADASVLRTRPDATSVDTGRLRLDVSVDGIDMTLSLAPSGLVRETAWLDAGLSDLSPPALGVYEGTVIGEPDSWVRAVVHEAAITGLIEIDGERYRLVPANLVGTLDYYLPKPGGGHGARAGDGSSLAEMLDAGDALRPPPELGGAQPGAAAASAGPTSDVRAVPLSIVVDSQFDRYHGGDGLAAALNDLNVADGIYRGFGFSLALDEVLTFDAERDPMASAAVPLETLLRRFRGYRLAQRTVFEGSALTYLFSGNPKTDVTLGLAWIDTLCRTDGYDVGVATPSEFGDVLLTHELGHSLGAQHDSDTECREESGYLMWPNISDRTPTTLSPCSESSVRRSHARSCLLDTVDLSLRAEDVGGSVRFLATNPDGALAVDATLALETGMARRDGWPAGCRARTPTSAECELGRLAPGETRALVLDAPEGDAVGATLAAIGVAELDPKDNVVATGEGRITLAETGAADGGRGVQLASAGDAIGATVTDVPGTAGPVAESDPSLAGGRAGGGTLGFVALLMLGVSAIARRRVSEARRRPGQVARRG